MENLFVIAGENFLQADEIIRKLEEQYNLSEFDKKVFYLDSFRLGEILREMDFPPVFSQKKLLVIKNAEKLKKKECEILLDAIKKSKDVVVVMVGTDVKEPFKKLSLEYSPFKSPEEILFSQIYSLRKKDDKKLREIIREYLSVREKNFQVIIGAAHIYLRNLILGSKKIDRVILKKIEQLHQIDFSLKVGKIHPGEELEIFFYYLFS